MSVTVLAVVSYPRLEEADRQWIESIRARHDPQADRIGVHLTLVFPAEAPPDDVAAEVSVVARSLTPIPFTIRRAKAVPDVIGGGGHVFLVPDEGRDEIARLHDRLYEGVMRPHLRMDIPFTPHLTVAAHADVDLCEHLARALNLDRRTVSGTLRSLDLVNVAGRRVDTIATFAFVDRSDPPETSG